MTKSVPLYGRQPTETTTVDCVFGVGIVTRWVNPQSENCASVDSRPAYVGSAFMRQVPTRCIQRYFTSTTLVDYFIVCQYFCTSPFIWPLYSYWDCHCVPLPIGSLLRCIILWHLSPRWNVPFTPHDCNKTRMPPKRNNWHACDVDLCWRYNLFFVFCRIDRHFCPTLPLGVGRYRTSPLGQSIALLPGIRSISYIHDEYWLPSLVSLHPRTRFFLKRFIIEQIWWLFPSFL